MNYEQIAAAGIISEAMYANELTMGQNHDVLRAAIVRALQSARKAPPGHIIDDAGVVRKVLGTLFYTDDGCVVADGGRVYFVNSNDNICEWDASGTGNHVPVHMCYSTREAAEAAKEGKA